MHHMLFQNRVKCVVTFVGVMMPYNHVKHTVIKAPGLKYFDRKFVLFLLLFYHFFIYLLKLWYSFWRSNIPWRHYPVILIGKQCFIITVQGENRFSTNLFDQHTHHTIESTAIRYFKLSHFPKIVLNEGTILVLRLFVSTICAPTCLIFSIIVYKRVNSYHIKCVVRFIRVFITSNSDIWLIPAVHYVFDLFYWPLGNPSKRQ